VKPQLNVIVGLRFPRGIQRSFALDRTYTPFSLHDPKANISFDFDQLEGYVGHELDSLIRDLLDIAVIVYMSDRYRKRDENWCRKIGIRMPVRNVSIWDAVKGDIVNLMSLLTGDDFDIYFVRGQGASTRFDGTKKANEDKRCVCLFSGGLDSLSGAVWALENRFKPILASHYSIGFFHSIQFKLATSLGALYKTDVPFWPVYLTRSKRASVIRPLNKPVEDSQWSRSFLYLSIGTAYALDQGIETVFIFENGILSINVPVSEARMNTRTAHPKFLGMYESLIHNVFGVKVRILNPFAARTKSEVVKQLDDERFRSLVRESISCWEYPRGVNLLAKRRGVSGFQGKHCGICFPCIVRRISLYNAGLSDRDDSYVINVFSEYPNVGRSAITTMTDLLRFCDQMDRKDPKEILFEYPHFSIDVEGVDPLELVDVYKRFGRETKQCFKDLGNSQLVSDFRSLLA